MNANLNLPWRVVKTESLITHASTNIEMLCVTWITVTANGQSLWDGGAVTYVYPGEEVIPPEEALELYRFVTLANKWGVVR